MSSGFVGIISLDVRLPGAASLKDRRSALARLRHGLEQRFKASVAEVGERDAPQHGTLLAAIAVPSQEACDERVSDLERWLDEAEVRVSIRQLRSVTPEDLA
jgi:uncharacterized protein YlxP (DUF503 family)